MSRKKILMEKLANKEIDLDSLTDDEFDEVADEYYGRITKRMVKLYKTNPEQFISVDEFFALLDKTK